MEAVRASGQASIAIGDATEAPLPGNLELAPGRTVAIGASQGPAVQAGLGLEGTSGSEVENEELPVCWVHTDPVVAAEELLCRKPGMVQRNCQTSLSSVLKIAEI